jgi:PAS domain S-box-containing protein
MPFKQPDAAEAQAYLAAIVESSDDAIISKNLDGVIQSCNAAAERIFGYTAEELIGHPVQMLIPAERLAEEQEILRRIRRGERVDHFETVRLAKGGRRVDISLTVSAVRDVSGTIIGASKVARDVTERKRAAAIAAAHAVERERLLEAERVARAEAERAGRVKDEFVAMVSHELRTPLNAILGWTQLLASSPDDQSLQKQGLDVIERNTRIQSQLIADLLDVSRMIAGKLEVILQPVELRPIVEDAIQATRLDAENKGISLVADLDPEPALIAGDPARLQQVIWNLLSNAIKFSDSGRHVRITLRRGDAHAEIVVADDGPGIRPEYLPHVFDRFNQADRTISRRFGGLGLGLAIVKHIVELHGGSVRADSRGEGEGSTFTVALPVAAYGGAVPVQESAPSTEVDALDGVRVLLVEDEPDTLEFLRRLLEGHGAAVVAVATAHEAIDHLHGPPPDVLISDIGLPGMDGYELMRHIRQQIPACERMPGIALTAYARAEDRTRALRGGYQTHIAKPVENSELVAAVAAFMRLRGRPQSADPR